MIREELNIESKLEFIEYRQISWWRHLQRMETEDRWKNNGKQKYKRDRKKEDQDIG